MMSKHIPTSYPVEIQGLLDWLRKHGVTGISEDCIHIKDSPGKGLGIFASKDYHVGDTIFTIPRKCIIGIGDTHHNHHIQRIMHHNVINDHKFTDELKIWMLMAEQRYDATSHYHPYLKTLDYDNLPTLVEWDAELLEALDGTNLSSTVRSSQQRIREYEVFLDDVKSIICDDMHHIDTSSPIPSSSSSSQDTTSSSGITITVKDIIWARAHYMSRRYLPEFPSSHDPSYTSSSQEADLGNIGSMCPLLDILNHDASCDWLKLQVDDEHDNLVIIANVVISRGSEIHYNYGKLPNEMLLYGYAYAMLGNPDDGVAVKLMIGNHASSSGDGHHKAAGLYYIRRGGLHGIPQELLRAFKAILYEGDDDDYDDDDDEYFDAEPYEMLHAYLNQKLISYQSSKHHADVILRRYGVNVDGDTGKIMHNDDIHGDVDMRAMFIYCYRRGQEEILTQTIQAIADKLATVVIVDDDDDDIEDDGDDI